MNEQILVGKQSVDTAMRILKRLEESAASGYDKSICYGCRLALEDLGLIEPGKK